MKYIQYILSSPSRYIRQTALFHHILPLGLRFNAKAHNHHTSLDRLNVGRLAQKRLDYDRTRLVFLVTGSVAGIIATLYTACQLRCSLGINTKKFDTSPSANSSVSPRSMIIVHKNNTMSSHTVPTGDNTVTHFPQTINLPNFRHDTQVSSAFLSDPTTDYILVGLGVRTVSFLGIRVYVVGFYIAAEDIAYLQRQMMEKFKPAATMSTTAEKDEMRASLLDPAKSYQIWNSLLQDGAPARSLFRIIPVRDTDFHHLRNGLIRAIQARAPPMLDNVKADISNEAPDFRESIRQFRRVFNHGKAPKKAELILLRSEGGTLSVIYDDGRPIGRQIFGVVDDERLSRALWLNYLGGIKVASSDAQRNIVNGLIKFIERPLET